LRGGEKEMLELLSHIEAFSCADAMEAYRRSPVFFEKWVDDYRLSLAREGKHVTVGAEPLLGYLLAREAEDKAVRMAATGIRTKQDAAVLRERMRELYG
jgi:V/A-type H+-transporting ATPase subunit C